MEYMNTEFYTEYNKEHYSEEVLKAHERMDEIEEEIDFLNFEQEDSPNPGDSVLLATLNRELQTLQDFVDSQEETV